MTPAAIWTPVTCAPQLYTDYKIEHGLSTQDVDYVFSPSVIYELPFGRGKRFGGDVSRWVDYAIGGWQFNAIYVLQGGTPFSITASGNPSSERADLVGKPVIHPGNIAKLRGRQRLRSPSPEFCRRLT